MQHHSHWVVFVAYFSFFNNCEAKQLQSENDIPYMLSRIFENRNKPPIILYLDSQQYDRSIEENPEDLRDILDDSEREEDTRSTETFLRTIQNDERAYILHHLLRSTLEEEQIDPVVAQNLEITKEFLRNSFIGRCRKLNTCLRQCPKPKIKYTCTVTCKQIFDDLDQCDEPKKNDCTTSKCGHTMPPTWLL